MSYPSHKPTAKLRAEVEAYATVGVPHKMIAALINTSDNTLLKHYARELEVGKAKATAQVAKTLFQLATVGKNLGAMIFWLKAQAGWREVQTIEFDDKSEQSDRERSARDYIIARLTRRVEETAVSVINEEDAAKRLQ